MMGPPPPPSTLRRLILLFHTLRHTRKAQLVRRGGLVVRRRLRGWAAAWGLAPGGWYRAPAPEEAPRDGWGRVRFAVVEGRARAAEAPTPGGGSPFTVPPGSPPSPSPPPPTSPSGGLPLQVQLPGSHWVVDKATRWRRPEVESLSPLARLTLHYMEFLPRLAPADAVTVMLDWIQANPPYAESDDWNAAWNSYAVSIRTVIWMDLLRGPLAPEAPATAAREPMVRARLLQSLAAQLRFLAANLETDIGGNHLMKNIRALIRGGRFFQGDEAAGWLRLGAGLLERELDEQILLDGMHFERSPAYHLQVLGDLLDVKAALGSQRREAGISHPAPLDDALARMLRAAALLTHPDGCPSLFADGGLHMTHAPAALRAAAGEMGIPLPESEGPEAAAWSLPDAGYFGWRGQSVGRAPGKADAGGGAGEEETGAAGQVDASGAAVGRAADDLLIVDCGPVGPDHLPAHGHGDALSFEWTVAGVRVVVDAGVAEYQGPLRPYSRSTAAHNTVTVDDADQSEFWSSFRVARRARARVEKWGVGAGVGAGARTGVATADAGGAGAAADASRPAAAADGSQPAAAASQPAAPPFHLVGSHDGYRRLAGSPIHRRKVEAGPGWLRVADEVVGGRGQSVRARLLLGPDIEVRQVDDGALLTVAATAFPRDSSGLTVRLSASVPLTLERGLWMPDFGVTQEVWQVVLDYGEAPTRGGFELTVDGGSGEGGG
ncbi:MAG: alginate lyase family protein [Gemmatimonadota bacterium]